jgi:hypothetical protein
MSQCLGMLAFTGITSGFCLLVLRYLGYFITGNAFYLEYGYKSLNILVLCIVMGLRQRFSDREYDTQVPFITGNLKISF